MLHLRPLLRNCSRNIAGLKPIQAARCASNFHYQNRENFRRNDGSERSRRFAAISTALGSAFGLSLLLLHQQSKVEALEKNDDVEPGLEIGSLPTYSLEEVGKHADAASSVWIVYKAGVYDVTDFVKVHPGGDYVLLAAGNSVEPFWEVYGQHKTQQVFKLLESFRIGNLREEDRLTPEQVKGQMDSMEYIPERNPRLVKHHEKPFNAETPLPDLVKNFITSK